MEAKLGDVSRHSTFVRALSRLVPALLILIPGAALAQTYSVRMEPITYEAMPTNGFPGGETPIDFFTSSTQWHESEHLVNIPWAFNFYGEQFSVMRAGADGLVTFGNDPAIAMDPDPIPTAAAPNNLVAIWWTRLLCNSSSNIGIVRSQVVGTAPNRRLVVDWPNCRAWGITSTRFKFQIWLTEGSDDIEVRYGLDVGTSTAVQASVGVENASGTDGTPGLPSCQGFCSTADFPEGMALIYSAGPNIRVGDLRGPVEGFAGIRFPLTYTLTNPGAAPANDFTVRYWVNSRPVLDDRAIPIGYANRSWSLEPRQQVEVADEPVLPIELEQGSFYLVVEADPHHAVDLSNRSGAVGVYGPFTLGIRAANLVADWVEGPEVLAPGQEYDLRWGISNQGNLDTSEVELRFTLGTHSYVNPSTRTIGTDIAGALPMGSAIEGTTRIGIPADVPPGTYHLGIQIDPRHEVFEHERLDNTAASSPVEVRDGELVVETTTLPVGEIHAPYSVRLLAQGGDGIYHWSVREGETLPPGLSLVTETSGSGAVATFLRGIPASSGSFHFTLMAASGPWASSHDYLLQIGEGSLALMITTQHLAEAAFGTRYEDVLAATGGAPPYTWELRGTLPLGVMLRDDGYLSGTPMEDGTFSLDVQVVDSMGARAVLPVVLRVAPPSEFTCVTRQLTGLRLGESLRVPLVAAGGSKFPDGSYNWRTESTRVLATGLGEEARVLENDPPPGLRLEEGWVLGRPERFGSYVWGLIARDADGKEARCPVRLDVPMDYGLTVVTSTVPKAIAGRSFRAHFTAVGGHGALEWSEYADGRVLADHGLEFEGAALVGTPPLSALEGEREREVSFLVRVEDEQGRVGFRSLTLHLMAEAPSGATPAADPTGSDCQAAGAGAASPWLLALVALGVLRRRAR